MNTEREAVSLDQSVGVRECGGRWERGGGRKGEGRRDFSPILVCPVG